MGLKQVQNCQKMSKKYVGSKNSMQYALKKPDLARLAI
jgi:hypothetical protein